MAGGLRSSIPLIRRALSSEFVASPARRSALLRPTLSNPLVSRDYATASAPKDEKVKVPLAVFGVSGNYASALYIAAVKAKVLEKVEAEILDLIAALKNSPTFYQFTKDLTVPVSIRKKILEDVCAQAKLNDITKNFLVVVAENGRLGHIEKIAKKFEELTMAHKGVVQATVTTVIPLPPEEEKELKETLQELLGEGKTVKLEQKIDPNILGGLVVEFNQKVFDMSIKTRAKQLERFLREPISF